MLEVEVLLQVPPEDVLALFELRLAFTYHLFFFRSENIIGINQFLGLDDNHTFGACDLDKIALLETQFLADLFGDHDLPSLPQFADRPCLPPRFQGMCPDIHTVRLADTRRCQRSR
jgi:hypothetical protein